MLGQRAALGMALPREQPQSSSGWGHGGFLGQSRPHSQAELWDTHSLPSLR